MYGNKSIQGWINNRTERCKNVNLFYLTELSLIRKSPHCGSEFRNSRFRCSHWVVYKITTLFQTIKSFSSSTLFFFTAPQLSSKHGVMAGFMEDWAWGEQISLPQFFLLCPQLNPFWPPQRATSPLLSGGNRVEFPVHVLSSSLGLSLQGTHWLPCHETTPHPVSHQHGQHFQTLQKIFLKILDLAWCHLVVMRHSQADMCEVCFRYFFI